MEKQSKIQESWTQYLAQSKFKSDLSYQLHGLTDKIKGFLIEGNINGAIEYSGEAVNVIFTLTKVDMAIIQLEKEIGFCDVDYTLN